MPRSQAEVRWAHSVLEGGVKGATLKQREYAQEVVSGMSGKSMADLPEHATGVGSPRGPRISMRPKRGIKNYGVKI